MKQKRGTHVSEQSIFPDDQPETQEDPMLGSSSCHVEESSEGQVFVLDNPSKSLTTGLIQRSCSVRPIQILEFFWVSVNDHEIRMNYSPFLLISLLVCLNMH